MATDLNPPQLGIFPGIEGDRSQWGDCGCWTCVEKHVDFSKGVFMPFIVCPLCGNKRCPKAMLHSNECSESNATSQPGSRFSDVGWCAHCRKPIVQATLGEVRRAAEEMGLRFNNPVMRAKDEGPKIWRHHDSGRAACSRHDRLTFASPSGQ